MIYNLCEINCVQLEHLACQQAKAIAIPISVALDYWFNSIPFYVVCVFMCVWVHSFLLFVGPFNKIYEVNPKQKRSIEIDVFINWQNSRNVWCEWWCLTPSIIRELNSIRFSFVFFLLNQTIHAKARLKWLCFLCISNCNKS